MAKRVSFDCALPKIELKTLNIKVYNGAFMSRFDGQNNEPCCCINGKLFFCTKWRCCPTASPKSIRVYGVDLGRIYVTNLAFVCI